MKKGGDIPSELLENARVRVMERKDIQSFKQSKHIYFYNREVEEKAVNFLLDLAKNSLAKYKTSLEDDNELLKNRVLMRSKFPYKF